MEPRKIHKIARLATIGLTIAGGAVGSVIGIAASMWGGIFVIVPVTTVFFAFVGTLIGAATEFALHMKWPPDYEI